MIGLGVTVPVTVLAMVWGLLYAPGAAAQRSDSRLQAAGRVDVLSAEVTAVHAGVELSAIAGRYTRIAAVGGVGGSWNADSSGISTRGEILGRFVLDPDFAVRWAPYAAGGLGVRYDRIVGWRADLIAALGLEGPNWNGVVPFFEVGYGGGARFALGLRRARAHGR
ncbi:MAG TPA: hypothetical protein VIQ74_07725 [Gemmatimonadaceae bacterium]